MALTYEPIATTTLGSAQANITFSSITSAYTDLRLVLVSTTSVADAVYLEFNATQGMTYSYTVLTGDGTSATSTRFTNMDFINISSSSGSSTTIPSMQIVDIFSYGGSTNKTVLVNIAEDRNGSGGVRATVGLWRSTNAITSIKLYPPSSNFKIGTTATLYGIKSA